MLVRYIPFSSPYVRYFSFLSLQMDQLPILHVFILENPILRLLAKCGVTSFTFPVVTSAKARVEECFREIESTKARGMDTTSTSTARRADLLSMFLKAKEERPDFFHDSRILTMAVSMDFAGSDVTAISLAAVFCYLLRCPGCHQKATEELDAIIQNGDIKNRYTSLVASAESQQLPYLDACVKEALRLHPAAGLPLERIVPTHGAEICGDAIVGCSA